MITADTLQRWRNAKVLLISNPNVDAEVQSTFLEMLIEAKQLRRENLQLVLSQELLERLADYVKVSQKQDFIPDHLANRYEQITDLCDTLGIDLDLCD